MAADKRALPRSAATEVIPRKASATGRGRRLVYLDQVVVSELAKVDVGRLKDSARATVVHRLAAALGRAVDRQSARCVETFFHRYESASLITGDADDRGRELFEAVWRVLKVHCNGLHLSTLEEVTSVQALQLIAMRKRIRYARRYRWRGALKPDPQERDGGRVSVGRAKFSIGVMWQPRTLLKPGWAERVERRRRSAPRDDYAKAVDRIGCELRDWAKKCNEHLSWASRWQAIARSDVDALIDSPDFVQLPVIDILCRLYAHVLCDRNRALQDSDAVDVEVLALAVPYCDAVITDAYMAQALRSRGLDAKYQTRVFTAKNAGLDEASEWLAKPRRPRTKPAGDG